MRTSVPPVADERTTLIAFLDWHRDTLRLKTEGLDAAQLAATLPPSDLTLGGMLKHLAYVEDYWFGVNLAGRDPQPPFADPAIWTADEDWDWHSAAEQTPEELRALYDRFVARSDEILAEHTDLDALCARRTHHAPDGLGLRWVLVHLIEEYARHLGHADLIRQSIDGSTGT